MDAGFGECRTALRAKPLATVMQQRAGALRRLHRVVNQRLDVRAPRADPAIGLRKIRLERALAGEPCLRLADVHAEELVEIPTEDGEKARPLAQGRPGMLREREDVGV